jgi:hypothetical protein
MTGSTTEIAVSSLVTVMILTLCVYTTYLNTSIPAWSCFYFSWRSGRKPIAGSRMNVGASLLVRGLKPARPATESTRCAFQTPQRRAERPAIRNRCEPNFGFSPRVNSCLTLPIPRSARRCGVWDFDLAAPAARASSVPTVGFTTQNSAVLKARSEEPSNLPVSARRVHFVVRSFADLVRNFFLKTYSKPNSTAGEA